MSVPGKLPFGPLGVPSSGRDGYERPPSLERELRLARIEAEQAALEAGSLRLQLAIAGSTSEQRRLEIARLNDVVAHLQEHVTELREQLTAALRARRQATVGGVVGSIVDAIDVGSGALDGRTVVRANVELKARLAIDGGTPGLVLVDPAHDVPESLSTLRFDVRPLPPALGGDASRTGTADVLAAALELQRSLDAVAPERQAATADARAAAAALAAADPGDLSAITLALVGTTQALAGLAASDPAVASAVAALDERRAALTPASSAAELAGVAAAIRDLAHALDRLPS